MLCVLTHFPFHSSIFGRPSLKKRTVRVGVAVDVPTVEDVVSQFTDLGEFVDFGDSRHMLSECWNAG